MQQHDSFRWAVGIENTFVPHTRPGLRALDEYELTQHYQLWREDLDRVADLGISHIRWGVPWYRVNPRPDQFDWAWVDQVLDYLVVRKGLQPILDLMHYGTPLWLENSFLNISYPQRVAEYANAFAERYSSLVRIYTPLNEPTVNAEFCGRHGQWPPYLQGEDGYVKLLLPLVRGMIHTAQAVRDAHKDAVFVQVEALGWVWSSDETLHDHVERHLAHTFLAFDLATGVVDTTHLLWPYLHEHGLDESGLAWFQDHAFAMDVLGVNLYPWSGGELHRDASGGVYRRGELDGSQLGSVLRHAWQRYGLPMMVTETSARRDVAGRAQWMDETIAAVRATRCEGIPVNGYTWFPALTMIDWAYRTGTEPLEHYLLHLGLWDAAFDQDGILQRRPTPLVERYNMYIQQGI